MLWPPYRGKESRFLKDQVSCQQHAQNLAVFGTLLLLTLSTDRHSPLCPSSGWVFSLEDDFSHNLHSSFKSQFKPFCQADVCALSGCPFLVCPLQHSILLFRGLTCTVCVRLGLLSLIKHDWLIIHSLLIMDSYMDRTAGGSKPRVRAYRTNMDHLKGKKFNSGSFS